MTKVVLSGVLCAALLASSGIVMVLANELSGIPHIDASAARTVSVLYGGLLPILLVALPLAGLNLGWWLEQRAPKPHQHAQAAGAAPGKVL